MTEGAAGMPERAVGMTKGTAGMTERGDCCHGVVRAEGG